MTLPSNSSRMLSKVYIFTLINLFLVYYVTPIIAQSPYDYQLQAIVWSPNGEFIAYSTGEDVCNPDIQGTVVIIDALTKNIIKTLPIPECTIHYLDWSPDSTRLAGASWDYFGFRVWDIVSNQVILISHTKSQGVFFVDWHPTLDLLLTSDLGGVGAIFNATTGDFDRLISIPASQARWSPDGDGVASVRSDLNNLYIERGSQESVLSGHQLPARTLDWSPDGNKLATAGYDNTVKVWNSGTGQELASFSVSNIWDVRWHPNSRQLAVSSFDGFVQVWDTETGQITDTYTNPGSVTAIAWSPDGTQLAYGGVGFTGELTIVEPTIAGHDVQPTATPHKSR